MDGCAGPSVDTGTQLVSQLKNEPSNSRHHGGHLTEYCVICLEQITERAIAVPCNHLTFDFSCLKSWLQQRSSCPLCNTTVTKVEHDWRSPTTFKTYLVPQGITGPRLDERNRSGAGPSHRTLARLSTFDEHRRAPGEFIVDTTLESRVRVYRDYSFSLLVGANAYSQYRDFSRETFRSSENLQSRARIFLRRELQVFTFLGNFPAPRVTSRDFLVEYVVAVLKVHELKGADGAAQVLIAEYLGEANALLFLHELHSWLRSPFARLQYWDSDVQYAKS